MMSNLDFMPLSMIVCEVRKKSGTSIPVTFHANKCCASDVLMKRLYENMHHNSLFFQQHHVSPSL